MLKHPLSTRTVFSLFVCSCARVSLSSQSTDQHVWSATEDGDYIQPPLWADYYAGSSVSSHSFSHTLTHTHAGNQSAKEAGSASLSAFVHPTRMALRDLSCVSCSSSSCCLPNRPSSVPHSVRASLPKPGSCLQPLDTTTNPGPLFVPCLSCCSGTIGRQRGASTGVHLSPSMSRGLTTWVSGPPRTPKPRQRQGRR